MAAQKTTRRSRKRRSSGAAPRAVRSPRRDEAGAAARAARVHRQAASDTTYGERPPSPFGGLPVSEVAIFAGAVALIIGWLGKTAPTLIVGVLVCALGVLEVSAREHFSGYRSHSTLLAGLLAVAVETVFGVLLVPRQRLILLIVVVPVFAIAVKLLRDRFAVARQARVRAIPPA